MADTGGRVPRGSHYSLYGDFVRRNVLGLLTPGYIVLFALGWVRGWDLGVIGGYPAYLGISLVLLSVGIAYVTGVTIRTIGARLGLVLEHPFSETHEDAQRRLIQFRNRHAADTAQSAERERYAAVAQVAGNGAAAVLLAALAFSLSAVAPPIQLWLAWLSGILLLLAHWESVYAQQSFELAALGRARDRGVVATFFSQSLLYGLSGPLGRAFSGLDLRGMRRRMRRRRRKAAA